MLGKKLICTEAIEEIIKERLAKKYKISAKEKKMIVKLRIRTTLGRLQIP